METKILKEIGLTDNEIIIYLEILRLGEALASDLADRTGVNRTLTYQILKNLMKRGLVSYVIKNNIKYFKAGNPSKILDFLKEKEQGIQKLIPELLKLKKPEKRKHSVELYEGKEGLKTILNDILRCKPKEFLDMTSGMTIVVLPRYWMDQWHNKRVKTIPVSKLLFNHTPIGIRRAKDMLRYTKTEVKFLPKGLESPSHIYIYANRVAITLWEKEFPFAILIKSKEVHQRFKEFFEWFWRLAK